MTVEVWKGDLRDKREIAVRETGIVVTHRIASTTRSPVEFQLVDPFPGRIDADEVGFHPEYEPPHGRIDADQAVMSGVVRPESGLVVRYGLRLDRPRQLEAIEDIQASVPPSIELAKPVDPESVDDADLETAAMTRSTSSSQPADGGSVPFFDWLRRNIQSAEGSNGPGEHAGETDDAEQSTDSPEESTAVEEEDTKSGAEPAGEPPSPVPGADEEPSDETGSAPAEVDGQAGEPPDHAGALADRPGEGGVAETLLHQLESGALSEEQQRRLATALVEVLAPDETPRRSTDIRLRAVESKLQQFEAYADALAAIIDEHGPAEEFLADVRADVESVEREVRELRNDLDRTVEAREALADRLDAVEDEVAVAGSRLERLEDRLESLRADHRAKVSALEGAVEDLEPAAEEVEQLSSAVTSLREEIEDVRSRHRAIARALTGAEERQG